MGKVKFYLKKYDRVTICHGEYRKTFYKKDEPFVCTEEEWQKILKDSGVFTTTKPVKEVSRNGKSG